MHKTVGMLAVIIALIIVFQGTSFAENPHPKKYGVEIMLGGSYYFMEDINDFLPSDFIGYEPEKINIGSQFGFGLIYRHMDNFGYQIGFNRLIAGVPVALEEKYEITTYLPGSPFESWAEQTVSGWELYALATWYLPMGSSDLMFGIGPAIYGAKLNRSIDIVRDATGSHLTGGSFYAAKGKAMGAIVSLGYEMPLGEKTGLAFQVGGRLGKVENIYYADPEGRLSDILVYKNPDMGIPLSVDFSGGFGKLTFRIYFEPAAEWRSPLE